ncbi:hypothetical protein BD769DRAFT_1412756 [Suillus cothurnatus]|nr:hypothetical protein BD769DRAFT_1412756 [Suillus cothurnatus]
MFSKLVLFSYLALFSLGFANAYPSGEHGAIARRRAATSSVLAVPPTVTTTMSIQTANGPMNETCVLAFTPVGDQIQEVQNCTMSTGVNVVNSVSTGSVASTSTSASMSATPTVQAAFSMPGRSLQVLPVGLGVFGSITGITIIIVALVTLERIRYRRVFRERRLAEQGAMMGYTGNSIGDKV